MRLESDGDAVEPGDRIQYGARVHVVREQAGGRGEHAGAEVAHRQLAQLAGERGQAERRQRRSQQRDPVALQDRADRVEAPLVGGRERLRVQDDEMAVHVEQAVRVGEGVVERLDVRGREDRRRGRVWIGRR